LNPAEVHFIREVIDERFGAASLQLLCSSNCLDEVANSHFMALAKPDPESFESALNQLRERKQILIFIDDQESNELAARDCGFDFYQIVSFSDLRVKTAAELTLKFT
jgi:HAD superfamily hydrolase (TIGR01509 family)